MSALLDAYNVVSAADNPMKLDPDYVFNYFIPDTMPDGTPKVNVSTLCLLTGIDGVPGDYASNRHTSLGLKIQVQIWYEYDDHLAEQYDKLLRDYMENNGFNEYYTNTVKDPDLPKLFLTAKFAVTEFTA